MLSQYGVFRCVTEGGGKPPPFLCHFDRAAVSGEICFGMTKEFDLLQRQARHDNNVLETVNIQRVPESIL